MASEVTGKALDWKLLGRVMHYVKPYNGKFIIATFLTIFLAAIALVQPILIQKTLDKYILGNDYNGLVFMVALMIAAYCTNRCAVLPNLFNQLARAIRNSRSAERYF
jgi:ABC-type bacteriocin/lantibiotic exporter with double-glycine peptidase domain